MVEPPVRAGLTGVHAATLLTGFQTDFPALFATGALAATAAFYLYGVRLLRRRGRNWQPRRTVSFLAGITVLWVAIGSGVAAYDDTSMPFHVVQHSLVMMIAPPLLVMGQPLVLATQAAPRPAQVRISSAIHGRVARALTHPAIGWPAYIGSMYFLLLDRSVYSYVVQHRPVHDATHLGLLALGLLYWQPLLANPAGRGQLGYAGRALGLMLAMPFEACLGVALRISSTPVNPGGSLADTRTAGVTFLALAMLTSGIWIVAVCVQWYGRMLREERRSASTAGSDWSLPWWQAGPAPAGAPGSREVT